MVLQVALICSAGVDLAKTECHVELGFFLHAEREQRWLLGYSGDRHLGRQHNGLTWVSVFMCQVHTRLILQHAVSYDRLRNWQFLPPTSSPDSYFLRIRCLREIRSSLTPLHTVSAMMKRLPMHQHSKVILLSPIYTFSDHHFYLVCGYIFLRHKKPSMKRGKVAMVTASQQL